MYEITLEFCVAVTLEDVQDDDNDADEPSPREIQLSQARQQEIIIKLIHCGEYL